MRTEYWYFYCETLRKECYYKRYHEFARWANTIVTVLCCITSALSIGDWAITGKIRLVFAVITALSQLALALTPLMPFSNQLVSLKFALPELSRLLINIQFDWNNIDNYSDDKISKRIQTHQLVYDDIESNFIGDTWFPHIKKLNILAENDRDAYLQKWRGIS